MSVIREDDSPWLAALIVIALIVAALLVWTRHPQAASVTPIVIHGRITATEEEQESCAFQIESLTISAPEQYTCDWLGGSVGHPMTVTFQPE